MKNKTIILTIVLIVANFISVAQPFRYLNPIFDDVDTIKNVPFAVAPWLNNKLDFLAPYPIHDSENLTELRPLLMDIFEPKNDTLSKRPAIVFLHGGAFLLGTRHNEDMVALCDSFARRGYVTAIIDYRLGMGADVSRLFGFVTDIHVREDNARRAVYRATQDSRAAVRFLKHNADVYRIDTTNIFLVGSSAGAIAALNHLYLDTDEVSTVIFNEPQLGEPDSIGIAGGYSAEPDAVVSFWGAVEDLNIIGKNTTPLFLVHGEEDDVVPYRKGVPLEGNIPPNPLVSFNMPETYGSFCIDTFLTNRQMQPETWFVKNEKHEFYGVDTGKFFETGPNHYWDTTIQNTNSFLFEQFKPKAAFEFEINHRTVSVVNQTENSMLTR